MNTVTDQIGEKVIENALYDEFKEHCNNTAESDIVQSRRLPLAVFNILQNIHNSETKKCIPVQQNDVYQNNISISSNCSGTKPFNPLQERRWYDHENLPVMAGARFRNRRVPEVAFYRNRSSAIGYHPKRYPAKAKRSGKLRVRQASHQAV